MSDLARAKREALAAKARLQETADELKVRTSPRHIAADIAGNARNRLTLAGERAGDLVRERPITVAAAAAVLAFVLLRKPLARVTRRRKREQPAPAKRLPDGRPRPDALAQFKPTPTSQSIFFQE